MKTRALVIFLILIIAGCRSKRHLTEESPFRRGLGPITWGASFALIDSLTAMDTLWKKVSTIENSQTGGHIWVIKESQREYYLEFDTKDRLYMISYIADTVDLDTMKKQLTKFYGEPEQNSKRVNSYRELSWNVEADSVHLAIQILITRKQYALKVENKKNFN